MTRAKDDSSSRQPSEREISQRQAVDNANAARDTHRSKLPGVDDDSEAIQGWVATLAAPIEGAADSIREDERARVKSKSPAGEVDSVTGPLAADAPNVPDSGQRKTQPPSRSEDAEWDPLKATAEHRSGNKRA